MFVSSVLDSAAIDEKQVQSFFSKLTLEKLLYAAVLLVLYILIWDKDFLSEKKPKDAAQDGAEDTNDASDR